MKRRLIIALAITSSLLAMAPVAAMAATGPRTGGLDGDSPDPYAVRPAEMHVFDMTEHPLVRPHQFVITGTAWVTGLHWHDWGGKHPVAAGTLEVNSCEPNCADGSDAHYPAQLQLRGSEDDQGATYYKDFRVVGESMTPKVLDEYGTWSSAFHPSDSE